jgi:hypothetical protein
MFAQMALIAGMSLLKQGMGFQAAQAEAKSKRQWQAYRNAMTMLANANNQNAITTNEVMLEDRLATQRFNIERSEYITEAAAEASAAAADTGGRSVSMVLFDIERNASIQQGRLQQDLEAQYVSNDEQRRNSAFQAATQMDYTHIPKPNLATYAMNFASDMVGGYLKYKES